MSPLCGIFKASALWLWANTFYKSICRVSVRVSICLFTIEVPFKRLFAPISRGRMSNIFKDSESLGKSNGKKWYQIWTFMFGCGLKSPNKKNCFFWLILPYKTWWKPRFPMDYRPLVKGRIANFGIFLDVFEFLCFGWFFSVFKKIGCLGFLGPPGNHASRWIRDLWSKGVLQMLAYF